MPGNDAKHLVNGHMVYATTTDRIAVQVAFASNWQAEPSVTIYAGKETRIFGVQSLTPPEGRAKRVLTLSNGNKLFIAAPDLPKHIDGNSWSAHVDRAEKLSLPILAVMTIVAIALIGALLYWSLPKLADQLANYIPDRVIEEISDNTLSQLDNLFFEPSNLSAQRQGEIEVKFRTLQKIANVDSNIEILFRSSPLIGANALALPGGPIILLDELVEIAPSDDGIHGVLAHEIAHITLGHNRRQLAREGVIGVLGLMLGNEVGGADLFKSLAFSSYSRAFETQADELARQWMNEAGFDITAFDEMLIALYQQHCAEDCPEEGAEERAGEAQGSSSSWFDSHPSLSERLAPKN